MFEELAEYEAAIRADERLKCAREVEAIGRNEWRNDVVPASVLAARLRAGAGTPPKACPTSDEPLGTCAIHGNYWTDDCLRCGSGIDGGTA